MSLSEPIMKVCHEPRSVINSTLQNRSKITFSSTYFFKNLGSKSIGDFKLHFLIQIYRTEQMLNQGGALKSECLA